ncbi:MAG: aromatic ring-hydroxylating dioxygenase subunit alpha [Alphaproteobacteria bacterium]|nr:aromatic ring-hydroxylating dioxygenase subunit alpha [Alphaproteobacteria bacterium]
MATAGTLAAPAYLGLEGTRPGLPAQFYVDAAHHEKELRALWYRSWIYVCRAADLREPRAFRTAAIGNQSILVVRNEKGTLRAFHNACRHRGSALCAEHEGRLRSRYIVCPYHGWAYNLDGGLAVVPGIDIPEDFDRSQYPLYDVALAEWGGCVFARLEGTGASIGDAIRPSSTYMANWPMAGLVTGHTERKVLACNWKVFWENFSECYHCPGVHPELCELVPIYGRSISRTHDDPEWQRHWDDPDPKYRGGLRQGAETWSADGRAIGPTFASLNDQERKAGHRFSTIWPTMYAVGHADYMRIVSMRPVAPEETELTVEWLFSPETLAGPRADLERAIEFGRMVVGQDGAVCELNQRGLRSRAHRQGVLMPQEHGVFAFHEWVRRGLAAL